MIKPRALLQSQLLTEVAEDSRLTVADVKKVLGSYEDVSKNKIMEGYKVPLPGGMGYIYLTLSRSESQTVELELTDTQAVILPKLRTIVAFSAPWRNFINTDSRSASLIGKLFKRKLEVKKSLNE